MDGNQLRTVEPAVGARPPVLIRATHLRKAYAGNSVLNDVTFELYAGDVVLLEGENGSGKTTLLNIVTGNLAPDGGDLRYAGAGDHLRAFRFIRGRAAGWGPETLARLGIGRSWQETRLFASLSLADNVAVAQPDQPGEQPLRVLLPAARARERQVQRDTIAALGRLGLGDRGGSSASAVSLGQAKRVAIARAVAGGAKMLLLDEPLAGLDAEGVCDVLALLRRLVDEEAITLVIVEHVLNHHHLDGLITQHWHLIDGRLAMRKAGPDTGQTPGVADDPAWMRALAVGADSVSQSDVFRGARLTRIRFPGAPVAAVLQLRSLEVRRGERRAVWGGSEDAGLDLDLFEGEIAVLQAPNGWGKSTLLQAITGLIPTHAGEVRLDGRNLGISPPWQRVAAGMRFVPSQPVLFPSLSGGDVLRLARAPGGLPSALQQRSVGQMSGGELQRLALASSPPGGRIWLFDEPFAALDEGAVAWAAGQIRRHRAGSILLTIPSMQPHRSNAS